MKLAVGGFLVFASLMSLSACAFMRTVGPCYGYGCSALHGASDASPKSAMLSQPTSPKPSAENAGNSKSVASKIKGVFAHHSKSEATKQPPADQQSNHGN